jgi:hypothetical protein
MGGNGCQRKQREGVHGGKWVPEEVRGELMDGYELLGSSEGAKC